MVVTPDNSGARPCADRLAVLHRASRPGTGEPARRGRSFVIIPRFADGDFTRLPRLVDELAAERLDVLVSRGPSVDYTKTIRSRVPVVFAYSGDPVAAGFADSLSKPGRNMTGITFMVLELSAKRVEMLKELVPHASRIALLSNPEHAGEVAEYRVTGDAARCLGAVVTRYLVRTPQELSAVFAEIRAARPEAMIVFPDDNFKTLAKFVDRNRIALTLNLGAARSIGLTVPPRILQRADRVIE